MANHISKSEYKRLKIQRANMNDTNIETNDLERTDSYKINLMVLTLTTIESDVKDLRDIDIDKYDNGGIALNQDDDWILLSLKMIQELGLFLTNLDMDN